MPVAVVDHLPSMVMFIMFKNTSEFMKFLPSVVCVMNDIRYFKSLRKMIEDRSMQWGTMFW